MSERIPLQGRSFGALTVLHYEKTVNGNAYWLCKCVCGREKEIVAGRLIGGAVNSCGKRDCLRKIGLAKTVEELFWDNVHKTDKCWNWTAALTSTGYGSLTRGKKRWKSHRYSWTLHFGPIPDGMCVCHKCDNPRCVRPDHLFLGTIKDNAQDALRKGRIATGNKLPQTKLTKNEVKEIRQRYFHNDERNKSALSKDYGVTSGTIRAIIQRRTWK